MGHLRKWLRGWNKCSCGSADDAFYICIFFNDIRKIILEIKMNKIYMKAQKDFRIN